MASLATAKEARAAALEPAASPRAQRFGRRLRGLPVPSFANLARQRRIEANLGNQRDRVAATLALLWFRPALDAELRGRRLGALAMIVGEDLFDRIRNAEVPFDTADAGTDLPIPDLLIAEGEALLNSIIDRPDLARLVELSLALIGESSSAESTA